MFLLKRPGILYQVGMNAQRYADVFEEIADGRASGNVLERLKAAVLESREQRTVFGVNERNIDGVFSDRIALLKRVFRRFEELRKELKIDEHLRETLWKYYIPLSEWVIKRVGEKRTRVREAYVLGLTGGQGSGKTTLAKVLALLLDEQGYRAVDFSLDDIYKTYREREALRERFPCYKVRGPPGTHDVELGLRVITVSYTHLTLPTKAEV
mgnify:CR=1 FL=1